MLRIGVNAARRLFWDFPLNQRLHILRTFFEIFERFAREGEEWYVELGISGFPEIFRVGKVRIGLDRRLARRIRRMATRRGFHLTLHAPHVNEFALPDLNLCAFDPSERARSVSYARAVIRLAELLDARMTTFHPGYIYKPGEKERQERALQNYPLYMRRAKELLLDSVSQLIPLAKKLRRVITLENMEPRLDVGYILIHPSELGALVSRVKSEWLGITYDVAHAALAAVHYKFDQLKNFKMLIDRVLKVHIHDNFCRPGLYGERSIEEGVGDLHLVPLIGRGHVPNEKILKMLSKEVLIVYELTPIEIEFRRSVTNLRRLFK
jgi:sugar phosphate isomerase/epimerase